MSDIKRVEYAQPINDEWQLPAIAVAFVVVVVAVVAVFYRPSLNKDASSGRQFNAEQLGQIQSNQPDLQPNAGSNQTGNSPSNASGSGGLQSAGTSEVFDQFEGGEL